MRPAWLHALQAAVLAPSCTLCHAASTITLDLCDACCDELPWQHRGCLYCAATLPATAASRVCSDCLRQPRFDAAHATFVYQPPVDWLIKQLKFHGRRSHARLLGTLLATRCAGDDTLPDYLLPVPLHPRRLRERGFNQAELLARQLGRELDLRTRTNLATRQRDTPSQSSLHAAQRKRNVHEAFATHGKCAGHDIAIVDDVVTTGHTAAALATQLKRNGAANIRLWCVARA